jgi:hypothetical protein
MHSDMNGLEMNVRYLNKLEPNLNTQLSFTHYSFYYYLEDTYLLYELWCKKISFDN